MVAIRNGPETPRSIIVGGPIRLSIIATNWLYLINTSYQTYYGASFKFPVGYYMISLLLLCHVISVDINL